VASLLGRSGEAAATYAREVVAADVEGAGGGALRKVKADLDAHGVAIPATEFQVKIDELTARAIIEAKTGT
jgi:hypothetical protein